jgi:hypothetical protein
MQTVREVREGPSPDCFIPPRENRDTSPKPPRKREFWRPQGVYFKTARDRCLCKAALKYPLPRRAFRRRLLVKGGDAKEYRLRLGVHFGKICRLSKV